MKIALTRVEQIIQEEIENVLEGMNEQRGSKPRIRSDWKTLKPNHPDRIAYRSALRNWKKGKPTANVKPVAAPKGPVKGPAYYMRDTSTSGGDYLPKSAKYHRGYKDVMYREDPPDEQGRVTSMEKSHTPKDWLKRVEKPLKYDPKKHALDENDLEEGAREREFNLAMQRGEHDNVFKGSKGPKSRGHGVSAKELTRPPETKASKKAKSRKAARARSKMRGQEIDASFGGRQPLEESELDEKRGGGSFVDWSDDPSRDFRNVDDAPSYLGADGYRDSTSIHVNDVGAGEGKIAIARDPSSKLGYFHVFDVDAIYAGKGIKKPRLMDNYKEVYRDKTHPDHELVKKQLAARRGYNTLMKNRHLRDIIKQKGDPYGQTNRKAVDPSTKPKLPKNWKSLSPSDPRRVAYRDWKKGKAPAPTGDAARAKRKEFLATATPGQLAKDKAALASAKKTQSTALADIENNKMANAERDRSALAKAKAMNRAGVEAVKRKKDVADAQDGTPLYERHSRHNLNIRAIIEEITDEVLAELDLDEKRKKKRKGKMPKKFSVKSGDKSKSGGLTSKGVKRYRKANPGSKLKNGRYQES
jgi:hypothetical protein